MKSLVLSSARVLLWLAASFGVAGCDRVDLDQEDARINYSVGYQVGSDFRRQGVEIDPELVVRGIADAMSGAEPSLTKLEMRKELTSLQKRVQDTQQAKPKEGGETNGEPAE